MLGKLRITLILAVIAVLAVPVAFADRLEGGGNTVYDEVEGGGTRMESGGTVIYDSIVPLGDKFEGGGYVIIPGLFGLFGQVVETTDVPWGTVPLTISRNGINLEITWDAGIYSNAKIYYLKGNGEGQFTNAHASWTQVLAGADSSEFDFTVDGRLVHKIQVNRGDPEVYYKCIQSSITPGDRHDGVDVFASARAVGKVDVDVERKAAAVSFYSFAVPLVPQDSDDLTYVVATDNFIGKADAGNLLEADQIREWNGSAWSSYYFSSDSGNWKLASDQTTAAEHTFGRGYVIRLRPASEGASPFKVTVLGQVLPGEYNSEVAYGGDRSVGRLGLSKFSAFCDPFPVLSTFDNAFGLNTADLQGRAAGQNLLEADQVRYWDHAGGGWVSAYYDGSAWKNVLDGTAAYGFRIGKGYVFRGANNKPEGGFTWRYQMP